jgi:PIN domain nuclease of toxin-antitoxin system
MVLLDTCALVWWTLDPKRLSARAKEACDNIKIEGAIISSISIWELGIKLKRGKLEINISLEEYVNRLKQLGTLKIIPVDETIWIKNLSLDWTHRDPADRTIVATAQLKNLPIITKDDFIRGYYAHIIW